MKRRLYLSLVMQDKLDDYHHYMSYYENQFRQSLQEQKVMTCSVFRYNYILFIYVEARVDTWFLEWPPAMRNLLEHWPSIHEMETAIELIDVFHDNRPVLGKPWRTTKPEQRKAAMARLNPEYVASYVYYHYQMQEERPGSFNKTYIIGSYGRYLFSYCELPADKGDTSPGRLSTSLTPNNWHEIMHPHFEPWDTSDEGALWKPMNLEFCFISTD